MEHLRTLHGAQYVHVSEKHELIIVWHGQSTIRLLSPSNLRDVGVMSLFSDNGGPPTLAQVKTAIEHLEAADAV